MDRDCTFLHMDLCNSTIIMTTMMVSKVKKHNFNVLGPMHRIADKRIL